MSESTFSTCRKTAMLHVRWVEEQRFWSRVDTGIKDIFSGYCKDKNFQLFSNTGKNGGPL